MYEYDENGNCVKRMEIYTDGSGVIYEYECDDEGNVVNETRTKYDGTVA